MHAQKADVSALSAEVAVHLSKAEELLEGGKHRQALEQLSLAQAPRGAAVRPMRAVEPWL
jgi:hypothetical protein